MTTAKAKKSVSKTDVERRVKKLREAWEKTPWPDEDPAEKMRSPDDKTHSKLKRAVYKLVRDCIKNDLMDVIEGWVDSEYSGTQKLKPSTKNKTNPFYWGLLAVCGPENELSRTTRSRFAQELQYAHMHDVPPRFLIGFIYQKGTSKDLQKKIDNKDMQLWGKKGSRKSID